MPTITMTVRGGAELQRNLNRLAGAQRRQAQQDGLEAGGRIVETHAKLLAPIDTGALKGSIEVYEATPVQALIGPSVDYAEHQEFGTVRMAAHPYMRPALDEHENEILDAIGNTVAAFVESVRA